ncbi:hypothetical protein SNARM312S_04548 [Streptomyces narbonensis]
MSASSGAAAPATLKYRRQAVDRPFAWPAARAIHSPTSLVSPYGLSGRHSVSSVTRSTSGMPYTEAEEEKRKLFTPAAAAASRMTWRPVTFSR